MKWGFVSGMAKVSLKALCPALPVQSHTLRLQKKLNKETPDPESFLN